jgi:hypothetical protein
MKLGPLYCNAYKCSLTLETFDEIQLGVCDKHRELMLRRDTFIGVCWNCCKVSMVGDRQNVIKDKYIFSKGCKSCGKEGESLNFMTIKSDTPPTTAVGYDVLRGRTYFTTITVDNHT